MGATDFHNVFSSRRERNVPGLNIQRVEFPAQMTRITCKRGNSLGWPKKRRNPPFFEKTVPPLTLNNEYSDGKFTIQQDHNRKLVCVELFNKTLERWWAPVVTCRSSYQWSLPALRKVLELSFGSELLWELQYCPGEVESFNLFSPASLEPAGCTQIPSSHSADWKHSRLQSRW